MVVSINGKGLSKSLEVITTMQQCKQSNKSLPIQLISKNNYKNEAMNSYFYDTTGEQNSYSFMTPQLHEIQKKIFSKVQSIRWTDIMSIRFVDSQMIYLVCTLWLLML